MMHNLKFNKGDKLFAIGVNPSYLMELARQQSSTPNELNEVFSRVAQEQGPALRQQLLDLIDACANTSIVEILDTKANKEVIIKTNGPEFLDALSQNPGFTRTRIARNKLENYIQDAYHLDKKFKEIEQSTAGTEPMPNGLDL